MSVHSLSAGGFWGFSLVVMVPYLCGCCGEWKFPHSHMNTQMWVSPQSLLCLRPADLYRGESTCLWLLSY